MSGYHDPLKTGDNADMSGARFYNRELADMADAMFPADERKPLYTDEETAQHRAEWLANKKPEQPTETEGEPMQQKTPATGKTFSFKTVVIVAIVAFALGWTAFCFWGNRNGRYKNFRSGNFSLILDTRTGDVFKPNERMVHK